MIEFTAEMIADLIDGVVDGDKGVRVSTISSIEEGKSGALSYLSNPKYERFLYQTNSSIVIVNKDFQPSTAHSATLIRVENVDQSVVRLLEMYDAMKPKRKGISRLASIAEGATIAEGSYVGDFAVVERGAEVGQDVQIYPQVYVGENVKIGDGTVIHPGVKLYNDVVIGRNCIIHAGAVLGADGFGFALKSDGSFAKIPQLGNVIVEDDVEIGANTCIDRAKTDSTIIRRGVKLDNLIQIGHNVQIGENTVSSAQTGVAGTSRVGSNCFIAGQVGIADHVNIGNRVTIASKSGISNDIPDDQMVFGYPAMLGRKYHRCHAVFRNLPELEMRVRNLEKNIDNKK